MRVLTLLSVLLLAACGQAGDLYLPAGQAPAKPAQQPPAPPAPPADQPPEDKKDKK